jgi:hypothetical protein
MSNLTTFQSRAYASFVFIDGDVKRFRIDFDGINYTHLAAGVMVLVWLLVLIGKMTTSHQATMMVDFIQAIVFSSKLLGVLLKAVAWGVFG